MRPLLATLVASLELVAGLHHPFSVHDDLYAYPQYEVIFSGSYISARDAKALLQGKEPPSSYESDFKHQDLARHLREAVDGEQPSEDAPIDTYEILRLMPEDDEYLCTIPTLETASPENVTASALAKQEEAKELSRASAAGWDLLNELEGTCLYFMSGWWSYSFCYNRQIVQFHALPMIPNGKPPVRDPNTMEFVLGRAPKALAKNQQHYTGSGNTGNPANADVQVKGDQRYLVQRLEAGDVCDLTGRERIIEIQYHCVPNMKTDRIAWIKEVTTCAYLMVVNTPRLCKDVAFLPSVQKSANPISCRLILDTDDPEAEAEWHRQKTLEAEAMMGVPAKGYDPEAVADAVFAGIIANGEEAGLEKFDLPDLDSHAFNEQENKPVVVGGIVVGGRQYLGPEGSDRRAAAALKAPSSYLPSRANAGKPKNEAPEVITTIMTRRSKADGGGYWQLSEAELDELELDKKLMNQMKEEMKKQAGDKGWKLEIAEAEGGSRELRGYVDDDSEGDDFFNEHGQRGLDDEYDDVEPQDEGSEEKFW